MTDIRTDAPGVSQGSAGALDQCRDIALIFSDAQLSELLDQAGGALLNFAERAQSNTMQGRFFEAMDLIRRQRPEISYVFRRALTSGFDELTKLPAVRAPVGAEPETPKSDSELTLLGPDDMEESVVADTLVNKANADCYPQLYALRQRLTSVLGGRELREAEVPAGPQHLVDAFASAIHPLDVDVKIKVVLYALFDKLIIREAKNLYDELNSSLKAAGVLPHLKPVHHRPPPSKGHPVTTSADRQEDPRAAAAVTGRTAPRGSGEQGPAYNLGAELIDSIIELMAERGAARGSAKGHQEDARPHGEPARAPATSQRLVSAIDKVQSRKARGYAAPATRAAPGDIPRLEIDAVFLEKIKQTLSTERQEILASIDREALAPMDADLIDLIGMLFEYMLNDPVLPNLAKALLSHLHTPYLKVAIIDRRLLFDARHPARRLFDQMVEAGSLWVDEAKPQRGIFPTMQAVVDRVLKEFTNDISLFEVLLGTFEAAMGEQQRRTDTMERRTQAAARGREKLQLAKKRARDHISRLLEGQPVPRAARVFLSRTWLDQLVFILLREPQAERSDAWRRAVATSEELVALFVAPATTGRDAQGRSETVTRLKRRISAGLQRMGSYSHAAVETLFSLLDHPDRWDEESAAVCDSLRATEPLHMASSHPRHADTTRQIPPDRVSDREREVIKRLHKLKLGTWFEFSAEHDGSSRRIKLSWLSPLTSTCIFVDRSGMQAEANTLEDLAQDILAGRARVVARPKHPFVERALVSIRRMLKERSGEEKERAGS
jgi:hypothetical protein